MYPVSLKMSPLSLLDPRCVKKVARSHLTYRFERRHWPLDPSSVRVGQPGSPVPSFALRENGTTHPGVPIVVVK